MTHLRMALVLWGVVGLAFGAALVFGRERNETIIRLGEPDAWVCVPYTEFHSGQPLHKAWACKQAKDVTDWLIHAGGVPK